MSIAKEAGRRLARIACLVILFAGFAQNARATTMALQTANAPALVSWIDLSGANSSATVGWLFTVGSQNLTLTDLGVFDAGADGLIESHQVGLWDTSGALLTSATVPGGTGGALAGGYRFVSATGVTLAAGTSYVIGAFYNAGVNDSILILSTQTFASEIAYLASRQTLLSCCGGSGTFAFPNVNAGVNQGVFGPNFRFDAPVPEPASLTLLGLGLAGVAAARRHRAK